MHASLKSSFFLLSDIWELARFPYKFPSPDLEELYKDFTLSDLESAMRDTPVRHAVFVQVLTKQDALREMGRGSDV